MAGQGGDKQDLSEATHEPRECMACRGTGRVISNLGGSPKTVACPWCEGSGLRPAEIDAQAHWSAATEGEGEPAKTDGADVPAPAAEGERPAEGAEAEAAAEPAQDTE